MAGPKELIRTCTRSLGQRVGLGLAAMGAVLGLIEHFWRKQIWWRVPSLRWMHLTFQREDGSLAMFERECYVTLLQPISILLLVAAVAVYLVSFALMRSGGPTGPP